MSDVEQDGRKKGSARKMPGSARNMSDTHSSNPAIRDGVVDTANKFTRASVGQRVGRLGLIMILMMIFLKIFATMVK